MRLNNTFSLTIQLTLLFVSLNISLAFSQYQIDLRSGSIQPVERVQLPGVLPEEISENHYIRIVQFFRIPDRESRKSLEDAGWRFLRYLSGSAYLIALPAETVLSYEKERNIRSVLRYQSEQKIDPQLLESPFLSGLWRMHIRFS